MKILIVTMVVAALGGGAYAFKTFGAQSDESGKIPEDGLFTVQRSTLRITITEDGTLVAKESQKLQLETRGQAKIMWLVPEGKDVKEGEELCKFDAKEIESRIEQIELDIVQGEANVKTARTEHEIQLTDNEATIEKAKIAVEKTEKDLERYLRGDAPQERRKLDIGIEDQKTEYAQAKKIYEDSQKLFAEEYIRKTELDEHEIRFRKAEIQLEGAHLDKQMFDTYTYPLTQKDKSTAHKDAVRDLQSAEKRAESQLSQKQVQVQQSEKRLQKLQERLTELKEDLSKMVLTAPCPGIVIYGDPRNSWFRQYIKVGGEVWSGNTLLTIPDLRVMQVKIKVHEADINKVKEGQSVKVTMDTYPGVVLEGKVSKIATIANSSEDYSGDSAVKKFDVEITMDQTGELVLKPGISAKAEIFIDQRKDALYMPIQCVFIEEGRHLCHVLGADGKSTRHQIEVGLSNDTFIEILSGIDEGDRVLLYNPDLGSESSSPRHQPEDEAAPAAPAGDAGEATPSGTPED